MNYETDDETAPPHPEHLRELRIAAGLTEIDLVEHLRLSPEQISDIEHGRQQAPVDLIIHWIKACGGSDNDLLVVAGGKRIRADLIERLEKMTEEELIRFSHVIGPIMDEHDRKEGLLPTRGPLATA